MSPWREAAFQKFLFGRMNEDKARRKKEAAIKQEAALKKQIADRPTEAQLATIDALVEDCQRNGLPVTRELLLYAMRPVKGGKK